MKQISIHKKHQQSGAALVIGLIILLVMTLLGVSSMSLARTELKIAGNMQSKSSAFQVAEAAIQEVVTSTSTKWGNIKTEQTFSYAPTDKKYSSVMTMGFEDCRSNPLNYDLSGDGIGDGRGSSNKATIHTVSSAGVAKSTAAVNAPIVANSTVVVGLATVLAGCTPPAAP